MTRTCPEGSTRTTVVSNPDSVIPSAVRMAEGPKLVASA
jgi:hypothetical protein